MVLNTQVEAVFDALADGTRRRLLQQLSREGPLTASQLAPDYGVTRQAVVKHLAILRTAGLVTSERAGNEVRFAVEAEPLAAAVDWLEQVGERWDRRLVALDKRLSARARDAPVATGVPAAVGPQ